MTSDLERSAGRLTDGLAARLRELVAAQSRWERFVPDPEGERGGEVVARPAPEEWRRVADETVLRALRVGLDPVNHAILSRLAGEETLALAALMETTGLPRLPLAERVGDLAQVGLAVWAPETSEARSTGAASGLLGLLAELGERLARILDETQKQPARPGRPA